MRRPGPLRDLPIERSTTPLPSSPFKSAHKRSRAESEASPGLLSPAKRRILNQEGFVSPEKKRADIFDVPPPGSPSRKLDFGTPENATRSSSLASSFSHHQLPLTPMCTPFGTKLAPSPELIIARPTEHGGEVGEFFNSPVRPSSQTVLPTPTHLHREIPPPPDRQSAHYPGFDVLFDTHIILPCSHSTTPTAAESESETDDTDSQKENVAPRIKVRKSAAASGSMDTVRAGLLLLSPASKRREKEKGPKSVLGSLGKSTVRSFTPARSLAANAELLNTPRPTLGKALISPGKTPMQERRERRMVLESEVDEGAGDYESGDEVDAAL